MYRGWRSRLVGLAYLSPALLFVLAFTVYPLGQMVWMSLHNWSLITPPRWVGPRQLHAGVRRPASSGCRSGSRSSTPLIITPILIVGGYLLALLTSGNSPLRRVTRTVVFIPVVIGLGVSSLLWYWLFSTDFGLVNQALHGPRAVISEPVVWLGRRRRPVQPARSSPRSCGRSSASG